MTLHGHALLRCSCGWCWYWWLFCVYRHGHTTFILLPGLFSDIKFPCFCCEGRVQFPGSRDDGPAEEKATRAVGGRILPKVPDEALQVSVK